VKYTDDGSHLYQCLGCKATWEAATAPGYFNNLMEVPAEAVGGFSYTEGNGNKKHFANRVTPEYVKTWTFCPVCGVQWKGAIRCDDDNERMLGPRRLRIQKLMYEHRPEPKYPGWYWIIEVRDTRDGYWSEKQRFDPNRTNAMEVYNWLLHCRDELDKFEEARATISRKVNWPAYGGPYVTTWNAQPHPSMKHGTAKEEANKEKPETVGKGR